MILLTSEDASLMDRWAVAVSGRGTLIRRVNLLAQAEGTLAGRRPDIMLLDLSLGDLSGATGIGGLLSFSPETRIIALSHQPNDDERIAALRAGARGYCNAYIDPRLLAKAVSTVQNGEAWVGRIRGIRANASRCSHAELDQATELDSGDPVELGRLYRELRGRFGQINVLGGCCGTDHRHIEQICGHCKLAA